jgi:hypothetical protein
MDGWSAIKKEIVKPGIIDVRKVRRWQRFRERLV